MLNPITSQSTYHRYIAVSTALSFLVGSAVWIAILLGAAHTLAGQEHGGSIDVALGPLVLNTISKVATGTGYIVSFSLSAGLFWYGASWAFLGVLIGAIRGRRATKVA